MHDSVATQQLIKEYSQELRQALGDKLKWRWDDHHSALLAEFSVDHAHSVMMTLKQFYPYSWNRKTIKKAPSSLKYRTRQFDCTTPDQQIMCADAQATNEVMVAWWPWGHGATVSVRIFRAPPLSEPEPRGWLDKLFNR